MCFPGGDPGWEGVFSPDAIISINKCQALNSYEWLFCAQGMNKCHHAFRFLFLINKGTESDWVRGVKGINPHGLSLSPSVSLLLSLSFCLSLSFSLFQRFWYAHHWVRREERDTLPHSITTSHLGGEPVWQSAWDGNGNGSVKTLQPPPPLSSCLLDYTKQIHLQIAHWGSIRMLASPPIQLQSPVHTYG